jgi:hypothetical protein
VKKVNPISGILVAAILVMASIGTITIQSAHAQAASKKVSGVGGGVDDNRRNVPGLGAPIATSGDKNIYVTWWSNKTGNDEVMFKASTYAGKTFGSKINLSNSSKSESQNAQITASGSNVYVSWWERNATSNEPVLRVSNDNGKTFGEKIMLSNNATTAKP